MPPASATSAKTAKLRVLCLHGYRQDAITFRSKTGSWRQSLKAQAEFFFCDGPHLAKEGFQGQPPEGNSWWSWDGEGERPSLATQYTGWEATEAAIASAMEQHAPIDGILSFSQGACCAAVYAVKAKLSSNLPKPQFLVFISGFLPRDETWAKEMLDTRIHVPTLHVFGEKDEIIPSERSKMLLNICDDARELQHSGGHFVPTCNAQVRQDVRSFFSQQAHSLRCTQE